MLDKLHWQSIPSDKAADIISAVNNTYDGFDFTTETASVRAADLAFYKDVLLLEIEDPVKCPERGVSWFLYHEKMQVYLDGSSAPIHDMNEFGNIKITEETAAEYVYFFGFFVHGEDGPFFIIENADFPAIDKKKIDFLALKKIKDSCKKLQLVKITDEGWFELTGTVLFGNALFGVKFLVTPNGMIEMIDDEPLIAEIPVIKIKPNY